MRRNRLSLSLSLWVLCCAPLVMHAQKNKAEPPPAPVHVSVAVPSMAVLPETEQLQAKGGLKITVAPVAYTAKELVRLHHRQITPKFSEALLGQHGPTDVFVERTYEPFLLVQPNRLRFQVHISNQMPRVFRGSGIAVQFNVAGKVQAINPSAYGDLVNIIVPPRGEQDIEIVGPEISSVPDPSTVGIFLYDVVTNTDTAGNVTEKQNFEWYFSYRGQIVERDLQGRAPERMWINPQSLRQ